MRLLALDTNVLIAFLRNPSAFADRFGDFDQIVLSPVVLGEYRAGLFDTKVGKANRKVLEEYLRNPAVKILPVTDRTSAVYAKVFQSLRKRGVPIPTNDMWIAAAALENGAALATDDGHFAAVEMLQIV